MEIQESTNKEVKRFDSRTDKEFMANGKRYLIETAIPVGRFMEFEILQLELMQGMSIEKVYERINVLYQLLNQQRFADCAVIANELRSNVVKKVEREPTVLKICALFINAEDEDRSTFNNDTVVRKLADWKAECLDMRDFFQFAFDLIPSYTNIYKQLTQTITEMEKVGQ